MHIITHTHIYIFINMYTYTHTYIYICTSILQCLFICWWYSSIHVFHPRHRQASVQQLRGDEVRLNEKWGSVSCGYDKMLLWHFFLCVFWGCSVICWLVCWVLTEFVGRFIQTHCFTQSSSVWPTWRQRNLVRLTEEDKAEKHMEMISISWSRSPTIHQWFLQRLFGYLDA